MPITPDGNYAADAGMPDFARENDILGFAEEIINYVLAELRENQEEWYSTFQAMTAQEQVFLFRAIADGFNDSVDN